MASSGFIQTLFSDREKQNPLYPHSKIQAISDNDGKGLDVILEELRQKIEAGGDFELPDTVMLKSGGKFTGAVEYTTLTGGNITSSGTISADRGFSTKGAVNADGNISGTKVYGAVWNDYAKYRESTEKIEPGQVVIENGDGSISISEKRLVPGASIVSDTYGFIIGETEKCKTPVATAGRVLRYPFEDKAIYKAGDAVCTGPNGTISKMTREEIKEYPDCILGYVSEIPTYEEWGGGINADRPPVKVDGRIWIKVK